MTTQLTSPVNALLINETEPFTALTFTTHTTLPKLSQYSAVANELCQEAARLNLDITGPIQWVYTGVNGDETNEFRLEIALPIRQPGGSSDKFAYKVFGMFRCATYTHTGPWSELMAVYDALFPQFYQEGYQNDGHVREVYSVVDLANQANCVTEIQVGIA